MSVFKKIAITLIFVFTNFCLLSRESQFHIKRMITDFRGVVSNGHKTICYGDYGIMTFTDNLGQTWEQQNFGDKYNILKIETDGSDFFGVTDYFLFRSYNNASYWLKQPISEESKIINMTIYNNSIFILTKDGILRSNKEMDVDNTPFLVLDSNYKYSELKTDGINLYFIRDSRILLKYNLINQNLDSIDLIKYFNLVDYTTVSGLQTYNNRIYAQISYKAKDNIDYYSLVKSEDNGKTWIQLTNQIYKGNCYKIIGNEIYYLMTAMKYDSTESFLTTQFSKIDSSHFSIDSTYFTIINDKDSISRYIRWEKNIIFNDFVVINNNIFAVGSNKMISVSNNKGKSFEFKSFFNGTNNGLYNNISFLNDTLIFVINGYGFNKTTNAGITWLPQKYSNYNYNVYSNFPKTYYLDLNGNGFANYNQINTNNDSSALITNDYGENIRKTNNKDLTTPINRICISSKGIDLGNAILFAVNPVKDTNGINSYLILRYDKSFHLLDSIRLKGILENIVRINENNIITLNLLTSGINKADSNGNTNYHYNYFLQKSTDKGITWDSINIDVPIHQKLLKSQNSINYYYSNIVYKKALKYNNFIFYPTTDNIIYKYDFINNRFDSIYCPANISNFKSLAIFISRSNLYIISNINNNIFYTKLSDNKPVLWDSLYPEDVFGKWNNYNLINNLNNKDAILSANMINDSTGFLIIGRSQQDFASSSKDFYLNFVRFSISTLVNVNDNINENKRVYFWNSPPYPTPSENKIQSKIYWNQQYNIDDANINIYNILGIKINSQNVVIEKLSPYSGLLTWNCSEMKSGLYIIQILLKGEQISIPVIIKK